MKDTFIHMVPTYLFLQDAVCNGPFMVDLCLPMGTTLYFSSIITGEESSYSFNLMLARDLYYMDLSTTHLQAYSLQVEEATFPHHLNLHVAPSCKTIQGFVLVRGRGRECLSTVRHEEQALTRCHGLSRAVIY